jgi:hypothetical protein
VESDAKSALICYQKADLYLFDMVKGGKTMYKKSLLSAIEGQSKAREMLTVELPENNWSFD